MTRWDKVIDILGGIFIIVLFLAAVVNSSYDYVNERWRYEWMREAPETRNLKYPPCGKVAE